MPRPKYKEKSVRITYKRRKAAPEYLLETKNIYISQMNGAQYRAYLDVRPENMSWEIVNVNQRKVVSEGSVPHTQYRWLKNLVKRELDRLGVWFDDEIRDNSYKLRQKEKKAQEEAEKKEE